MFTRPQQCSFRPVSSLVLAASIAAWLTPSHSRAASASWDGGGANGNWSNSLNWAGDPTAPGTAGLTNSTDLATFDSAIANTWGTSGSPIVIDSGRNIGGITFTAASGSYFVGSTAGNTLLLSSGGSIQVTNSLTGTSVALRVNAPLEIEGTNGTFSLINNAGFSGVGSATITFGGSIRGGAAGATVLSLGGTNINFNTVSGTISDGSATSLALTSSGGSWIVSGNNSYTGGTTVTSGSFYVGSDTAVGTGTVTLGGGSLRDFNGARNIANNITLAGSTSSGVDSVFGTLTLSGIISGTGNLVQNGPLVILANANTYTGRTSIGNGTPGVLSIDTIADANSGTPTAVGNPTLANASIFINSGSTLRYTGSTLGSSNRPINIASGTVASLDASGSATFALSGGLSTSSTSGTSTLGLTGTTNGSASGVIANGGGTNVVALTKSGAGQWTLTAANTFTGGATVNAGTLLANNTSGSATGTGSVTVNNTGTFGGTGTISGAVSVTAGGTLAPGAANIESLGTGNLSLTATNAHVSFEIDLGGSLAADLLNVTGSLSLGSSTLDLSLLNATPAPMSKTFLLVQNDGDGITGDTVTGTFGAVNLPAGFYATVDYAYSGVDSLGRVGNGNDVAVTIVPEPGSIGLLAFGGIALLRRRSRKR